MTTQPREADEYLVKTEENELSLEEMSSALPDTPAVMEKVGHSWWHLIYAARGGNWDLAGYYLERLERFQREALPDVVAALELHDIDRLEGAYAAATDLANQMHVESGYPYIRWELPAQPPAGLQLSHVDAPPTIAR
jgi:hypothetical protein